MPHRASEQLADRPVASELRERYHRLVNWREDKTLIVLWSTAVFLGCLVVLVVCLRPQDEMLYTLFSTQFSGFAGALVLHLTRDKVPPDGSTTTTKIDQTTVTPPAPVSPITPPSAPVVVK